MMTEAERAKELARAVVLAQGNVFIKELLREKEGRIGATKEDFARNLDTAIDEGKIRLADIEDWAQRVEGWGLQYVYLWHVPRAVATLARWRDPAAVRRAARAAGLGDVWDAPTAQAFPETMTLSHASYTSGRLLFQWHEAGTSWIRDTDKDIPPRPEGDDIYRYDAYRQRGERSVMRFEFRPADAVAAAFLPQPVTTGAHVGALDQMFASVDPLVPRTRLVAFNVGQAISRLDEAQLRSGSDFRTQTTRLSGQGAYVEFGSSVPGHGYREVDAIREVRLAVQPGSVASNTATILFSAPAPAGPARQVRVQFYGLDGRIWVRAQMTAEQMWTLLDQIQSIV
jgi:hypothetical protein